MLPHKCLALVCHQNHLKHSIHELLPLTKKFTGFWCGWYECMVQDIRKVLCSGLGNGAALPGIPLLILLELDEGIGVPAHTAAKVAEGVPWFDER